MATPTSATAIINELADQANLSASLHERFGKFQRRGSTYCWTIYRPGRHNLYGFSHPVGGSEKSDGQQLLLDIINRLQRSPKDYLKRGCSVMFYRCFSDDNRDNVKLLTLYETRFELEPVALDQTWLVLFLKEFYESPVVRYGTELFPKGKPAPVGAQLIPERPAYHEKSMYDENRRFKSEDALMSYVQGLLEKGEPKGRVEDYYRKMSIKLMNNRR